MNIPLNHYKIPLNHDKIPLNHYKIPLNHDKIPLNHYKIPLNHYKIPLNHYKMDSMAPRNHRSRQGGPGLTGAGPTGLALVGRTSGAGTFGTPHCLEHGAPYFSIVL